MVIVNIYAFNNNIKKIGAEGIWQLRTNGGTNIEKCLQRIKKNKRPSVILTDGEDNFDTYTENGFIMTIEAGNRTGGYNTDSYKKMVRNKTTIYSIQKI